MKHKFLLISIIYLELSIIFLAGTNIYKKYNKVLGTMSVNPINKNYITYMSGNLKYFYEPLPSISITDAQTWLPYEANHTINSDSLNERFEYEGQKPVKTFRIITIGDSHTYGLHVNTNESYPEQLEELLNINVNNCKDVNKFEVINLGFGGYDVEYSVERFKIRGKKYDPDLVLWFLKDDDFLQIIELMRPKIDMYEQQLKKNNGFQEWREKGNYYPQYYLALKDLQETMSTQQILNYQVKALKSINLYHKGWLVLFTTPRTQDHYKRLIKDFVDERPKTYFFDEITKYYNLGEILPDGHPTAKAYMLIAQDLFNYLKINNIIPCN